MRETVTGFGLTFARARPVVVPGNSPTGAADRLSSRGVRAVPVLPLPGCAIIESCWGRMQVELLKG